MRSTAAFFMAAARGSGPLRELEYFFADSLGGLHPLVVKAGLTPIPPNITEKFPPLQYPPAGNRHAKSTWHVDCCPTGSAKEVTRFYPPPGPPQGGGNAFFSTRLFVFVRVKKKKRLIPESSRIDCFF